MTKHRILIVDDDGVNRFVTRNILSKQGYETLEADTGATAVTLFRTEAVDLILMDVSMPEMDGTEATRMIRALSNQGATVPILGFTAHAFEDDIQHCLAAGMNACIAKPVKGPELIEHIREWVT